MSKFNHKTGLIEKEEGDCQWESPDFVKNFWFYIMDGTPLMESPKHKKINLLK